MPLMMSRALYRMLLRLHPAEFRERFAEEMQWIFEEAAGKWGITSLVTDAGLSLARQWLIRSDLWKWLVAGIAGMVPLLVAFGSFLFADRTLGR
jgi:hypothetical protein